MSADRQRGEDRTSPSRRRDAFGLLAGILGVTATGAIARRGLPETEHEVFRAANELPAEAYPVLWAPMQYGTLGTAPALGALAALRGRRHLAVSLVASGVIAWTAAKAAKEIVRRERPARMLRDVRIRGEDEGDLGFPSGHAAVSAALTTSAIPFLSPAGRAGAIGLAGVVSFARVYIGAHLPLDVAGGASLGIAVGSLVRIVVGRNGRDRNR